MTIGTASKLVKMIMGGASEEALLKEGTKFLGKINARITSYGKEVGGELSILEQIKDIVYAKNTTASSKSLLKTVESSYGVDIFSTSKANVKTFINLLSEQTKYRQNHPSERWGKSFDETLEQIPTFEKRIREIEKELSKKQRLDEAIENYTRQMQKNEERINKNLEKYNKVNWEISKLKEDSQDPYAREKIEKLEAKRAKLESSMDVEESRIAGYKEKIKTAEKESNRSDVLSENVNMQRITKKMDKEEAERAKEHNRQAAIDELRLRAEQQWEGSISDVIDKMYEQQRKGNHEYDDILAELGVKGQKWDSLLLERVNLAAMGIKVKPAFS